MRTLTNTLESAQQSGSIKALVKVVLTHGATTYTYEKDRILKIDETEDGELQSAEVVLHNRDGALTDLDLKGYQAVISFGAITSAGEEYSSCAPMYVISQNFSSQPDELSCTLALVGIFKLMMDDNASEAYIPESTDTKSVKTLVDEIITATMTCFAHCTAYSSEWDAGYDDLADSYLSKDSFRIYTGGDRKSAIDRLLQYTANVARVESDGKVHIMKATTTGTTYDYEYSLESGHPFFSKALRNRLVIPNYIVVKSRGDDSPSYSGYAQDATSYALLPKREYFETYLTSNAQATAIAEAKLAINQMWCDAGSASVSMNVGQEPFDYVKVTDEREDDYRVGNIGQLRRHYSVSPKGRQSNRWETTFIFGNWQTVRKALANLNITSDELQNYFSRLSVGDLYVEHILADNIDLVWIDPDGTIDLSKIGDTLDNLPDGEVYARVKSLHLDAEGGIKLDENIIYNPGYNPSTKKRNFTSTPTTPYDVGDLWHDASNVKVCTTARASGSYVAGDWGATTLDAIANGTTYRRVKSAALSTDGLVLLDQTQVGTYGLVKYTDITQGHIELGSCLGDLSDIDGDLDDIANGATYGRIRLTCTDGNGYMELNSLTKVDGQWYNNKGVLMSSAYGIRLYGGQVALSTHPTYTDAVNNTNIQCYIGTDGCIYSGAGDVKLASDGITIKGERLKFYDGGNYKGYLRAVVGGLAVRTYGTLGIETDANVEITTPTNYGLLAANCTYITLPRKTSAPSSPSEGMAVYNQTTGYWNVYHSGAWWHANRDAGWA